MDKHFEDNDVSRFLDQVTDQIAYRPLRPSIRRELADHLEDRTQDYEADDMSHEEAVRQKVAALRRLPGLSCPPGKRTLDLPLREV